MKLLPKIAEWWGVLPLLLLTMALTSPRLDMDGLWYDEVWSVINAGGAHYGAMSPVDIWQHLATNDPDQGIAYPLLLSAWGHIAGWSELTTRLLSLFAGILTLAGVYRLGRMWLTPTAGLVAAALLSVNAFYINYLHELRVFSIVTLAAVLVLACYGRLLFADIPRFSRYWVLVRVGLVVGGLGLLYTHYVAATLLLALGIVHLMFGVGMLLLPSRPLMRDTFPDAAAFWRRWWQIVGLALVVALLFAPWLPVLMNSFARTSTRSDVHERALTTFDLLETIGRYFLNGTLPGLGIALLGVLGVGGVWVWWHAGTDKRYRAQVAWLLLVTGWLLGIMVALNAVLRIIEPNRARYVLVLWVPLALSVAIIADGVWAFIRQQGRWRWLLAAGLSLWFLNALVVYQDTDFLRAVDGGDTVRWRTLTTILARDGLVSDVLVFYAGTPKTAYDNQFSFEHSTHDLRMPHFQSAIFLDETHRDWGAAQVAQAHRVWYGVDKRQPITEAYTVFEPMLAGFAACQTVVDDAQIRLVLYGRYAAFCPQATVIRQFPAGINLLAYEWQRQANQLEVATSWQLQPEVPPETYSVSVQLLDATGALITQEDKGLSHSHFATMLSELDLAAVPIGVYQIRLVVYAWQTGAVVGDMLLDEKFSYSQ